MNLVVWFGVMGGAMAWAVQHVAGYAFGIAQCNPPTNRWQIAVHSWQAALAAAALVIGLLALAVSFRTFLRTRPDDNEPVGDFPHRPVRQEPLDRIYFLATLGLVINPLAIAIIVMDGIGAPLLSLCHQS